jgi:hypothetical protein
MREQLDELKRVNLAITALLECRMISATTRKQLESFKDDVEHEIEFLQNKLLQMSASWSRLRPRSAEDPGIGLR